MGLSPKRGALGSVLTGSQKEATDGPMRHPEHEDGEGENLFEAAGLEVDLDELAAAQRQALRTLEARVKNETVGGLEVDKGSS